MRGNHRFKVKGKLAPRYVGPFKIIDHKGEVAYQLELSPQLSDVHDVFHVSQLKKCLRALKEQLLNSKKNYLKFKKNFFLNFGPSPIFGPVAAHLPSP
jgi:hypothetical protein